MARKVILDQYYTFTPSTKTIVIPRAVPKERLMLITDVTTNQVIFNFSDPNLTSTSHTIATSADGYTTSTTVVLAYNTTGLSATDKLQIVIDEYDEKFSPSESYTDPINKLRVSTPQSLIDTDYEYSIQTTKWEQLGMINNQPFAYYTTDKNLNVTNVTATTSSRTYVANVTTSTAPAVGSPIVMLDSLFAGADGLYIVDSNTVVNGANTFSYTGKYAFTGTTGSIFNSGVTVSYQGQVFSNAAISIASASVATGNLVTVITSQAHNLSPGNEIAFTGANTANGSWTVSTVVSPTVFQFYASNGVSTPTTGAVTVTNASLYTRPQGLAVHRAYDGGVRFSTNATSHNQQYIRQTRRYFRYQSGKGIQMSTGTTLRPQLTLDGLSYNNTTGVVTATVKDPHDINSPTVIAISGANETGYNGTFTILNVINAYQFTYKPTTAPTASQASGPYYGSVVNWTGAENRIGIFDQQNGLFWRYDGQQLSVVRRSSTFQISGQVNATPGSTSITANASYPTFFSKQLAVNDFIVIKGMSYRVTGILSDQSMIISPAYRGINALTNATISKTVDTIITQSNFNIDKLDGTGPSGYTIDLNKMQMLYIDYSWYGAGFIRFGVRGADGNVTYCHKIINNNVNYLAYMRSGNLPGRYETNTFNKTTTLAQTIGSSDTSLIATDLTNWPTSGSAWIKSANTGGTGAAASEFVTYTGITGNTMTGLTRGQAGATVTGAGTTLGNNIVTVSSTAGIQVNQYVFGPNIPNQAFVTSFVPSTSVTLNQAATATGTGTLYFAPLSNTATGFTVTATAPTSIELHSPLVSPEVNHWGTSAIMDGGFTNDKSFIFTKGMTSGVSVSQGASQALMSFRISPSASNGVAGAALGIREVINRMQQLPFEVDMYGNGSFLVTCTLNGTTSSTAESWTNVGGSSLSQYIFHGAGVTVSGGEPVFGFYLNSAQGTYATTQQDLTQLLALGTSILSGGTSGAAVGVYPNGPDVLTFSVQNIDTASRNVQARYSWNEAQA
jgi:hypothetical protein